MKFHEFLEFPPVISSQRYVLVSLVTLVWCHPDFFRRTSQSTRFRRLPTGLKARTMLAGPFFDFLSASKIEIQCLGHLTVWCAMKLGGHKKQDSMGMGPIYKSIAVLPSHKSCQK